MESHAPVRGRGAKAGLRCGGGAEESPFPFSHVRSSVRACVAEDRACVAEIVLLRSHLALRVITSVPLVHCSLAPALAAPHHPLMASSYYNQAAQPCDGIPLLPLPACGGRRLHASLPSPACEGGADERLFSHVRGSHCFSAAAIAAAIAAIAATAIAALPTK